MDYVKDGTLTIQARTIKEVNSIDRVVVYADGCQREYLMPLPEERKEGEWVELQQNDDGTHSIQCSVCRFCFKSKGHARSYYTKKHYVFCSHCGSRMQSQINTAENTDENE